jgi:hypothetical protein
LLVVHGPLPMAGCAVEEMGEQNAAGPLSVVSDSSSGPSETVEAKDEASELAEAHLPSLAACPDQPDVQARVSTNPMTREPDYEEGFTVEESEAIRRGCEKVRLARVESLRKLNEQARREAEEAMALRRFRLRVQRKQNGKSDGPPTGLEADNEQTNKKGSVGRNKKELDQLTDTVMELQNQARRART